MAAFILRAVHQGSGFTSATGITGMAVGSFQGGLRLFTASEATGGLAAFGLGAGLAATFLGEVAAGARTGTYGACDIELVSLGGEMFLTAAARYDDEIAFRALGADGGFLAVRTIPPMAQSTAALGAIEIVSAGDRGLMVAGRATGAGLEVFGLSAGPALAHLGGLADDGALALANVSALASLKTGAAQFLFAASSVEHGITSLTIDGGGALSVVDTVYGMKGVGIHQPTRLATVSADAGDFLVVGAAGSSNLTVYGIGADGSLGFRDMVWDTLDTRFRAVTALDTFELNGRAFVLAGGNDGGLSLFELGPDGHLYFLSNAIDTAATTLASVAAIETVNVGGDVQVFVSSATEAGVTQFHLDLGAIGNTVAPSGPASDAVGGIGDDFLFGSDARNTLWGMRGNDRIVDGGGIDRLCGGTGVDTFIFVQDGVYDFIMDYERGADRIDLSDFDMVYSMARLTISSTASGARIGIGDEAILLTTMDGQPLTAADFSNASFLF
ncbi:M10 family metallopeptidase C-terminal domain-containing protein [Albidovulum sp.]|uniref:M10 family metallopeptidase C-terminal domain-containing protein n=1 Tax=Albidovulum sp. TaxID=1872424 RepID=UPI0039B99C5C